MTWLSDAADYIGGLFGGDSSGSGSGLSDSWLGRNWDSIANIADKGRQVYNYLDMNNARQGTRSDLLGAYQQMAAQDALYQQQLAQYQQGQAAAARANDAARRAAANKALKVQKKYLKQLEKNYQPYADAAKMLTPEMGKNFKQYLDTTSLLNQYLAPTVMQQFQQPVQPTYQMNVPESAYAAPKVEGQAVSFPTVEELMRRK